MLAARPPATSALEEVAVEPRRLDVGDAVAFAVLVGLARVEAELLALLRVRADGGADADRAVAAIAVTDARVGERVAAADETKGKTKGKDELLHHQRTLSRSAPPSTGEMCPWIANAARDRPSPRGSESPVRGRAPTRSYEFRADPRGDLTMPSTIRADRGGLDASQAVEAARVVPQQVLDRLVVKLTGVGPQVGLDLAIGNLAEDPEERERVR